MPHLTVTSTELRNMLPQLSPAARAAVIYDPGPDEGPGTIHFPEEHEAEILAVDIGNASTALSAYARDLRWRKEIGGIIVAGVPVATDDRSKIMIVGARVAAQADPAWQTVWQGADGNAYPINASALIAISDAVHEHVNSTFRTLATVLEAVATEAITTEDEVDQAFNNAA